MMIKMINRNFLAAIFRQGSFAIPHNIDVKVGLEAPELTPVVSSHVSPLEDALPTCHVLGQLVVELKHTISGARIEPEKKNRDRCYW